MITDHKPLVSLINTQDLNRTQLRYQKQLKGFFPYNVVAAFQRGKHLLVVPDTPTRGPLMESASNISEDKSYIDSVLETEPLSDGRFDDFRT